MNTRAATTTEGWENKSPGEIISEIEGMKKRIESYQPPPMPLAYAGGRVYEMMERRLYDPESAGIEKSDLLPDDTVFIPSKNTIIRYTGDFET